MIPQVTLATKGIDSLIGLLQTLSGSGWMVQAANEAATTIEQELARYPSARRRKQPFKSDKQRRFFFAALADGRIRVPYQRSGALGRGWRAGVVQLGSGLNITVGNTVAYAPYVQGSTQAAYHKGNWQTVSEASRGIEQRVVSIFDRRVDQIIRNGQATATFDSRAGVLRDSASGRFTSVAQATR